MLASALVVTAGGTPCVFNDLNEVKAAVGTEVGVSDWVEVTQDRIDQFAEATGDEQWTHVDVERASRELPGRSTIAHGLLTLSLAPWFVRSVMGVKGIKNTLNYRANRIRYLAPVPAGSKLRGRIRVAEADDMPSNGLRVTYGITIEIEGANALLVSPKRSLCIINDVHD